MSIPNRQHVGTPDAGPGETAALDHHKTDLVMQGFNCLSAHQFHWPSSIPSDIPTDISIERLRSKRDIHDHLHSTLLPQLKHQLRIISEALDNPADLRKEPCSKLQLILDTQHTLHRTLDQIIRAVDEIIPGIVPEPIQTNDQHFQELKCYRLHGLDEAIRSRLRIDLINYFDTSSSIIEKIKLSKNKHPGRINYNSIVVNRSIDLAIKWLKGSELHIIPNLWVDATQNIYSAYSEYFNMFRPHLEPMMSQPATQLSRSVLPIIKLSKLFFDKLEREAKRQKQAPLFTEMSSHQLNFLHQSAEELGDAVMNLIFDLEDADTHPPADTSSYLIRNIGMLSKLFQPYVHLAELYIAALFPDINGLSSQTYFRSWFVSWNTMFLTASHNAIQAANAFAQND
ncbi:hypothetical protein PtA15_14A413 [Puccinia triticina]|nr:uncharacterized protein PtA15_14A413 [Puccinia triticina]WAQ91529.1 hypothetical protein PtA15_14A413 [Puccinia triticina]